MRGSTVVVAQLAFTYLPRQAVFDTRPGALLGGIVIIGIGAALFLIVETEKRLAERLGFL